MATKGGQIEFDIGFNVNTQSLQTALQELKSIQSLDKIDIPGFEGSIAELNEAKKAAQALENAFESAFNKDLGVLNLTKFKNQIENTYGSIKKVGQSLNTAGEIGISAWRRISTEIITTNTYIKESDRLISKIAETLGNTIKWNISSSAVNKLSGSIQEAWGFTKALDGSLNDIQIVTNKSSEDMAKFAVQANNAAKALGTTTTAYTDAALTFYQQGLSDEDVAARAETSLKVSNVTGLSGDQSAEYVTAVLNGYKVAAEDAEEAMDKLAAVGAATASSLAELSEGMAKVASAANAMGVSEDQLAATLSTVISVTRQDASTVGTAFKTIYARISDIKAGTADAEVSLGNYTKKMAEMGFSVLDSTGNMRDLGEVIEEIGGKWASLSREQQISLAQTMAGTRQYNNLIALFDNWAEYEDALNVSMQANGTLQKQQEIYAESYTAKLNELTAAKEKLFMAIVDEDGIKDIISGFTIVIDKVATFVEALGGGKTLLLELGIILTKVFNKQISESLVNLNKNIQGLKTNIQNTSIKSSLMSEMEGQDVVVDKILADYKELSVIMSSLSEKEQNQMMNFLKQKAILEEELELEKQRVEENRKIIELASGNKIDEGKQDYTQQEKSKNKVEAEKNIDAFSNVSIEFEELQKIEDCYSNIALIEEDIKNDEKEKQALLSKNAELTDEEKNRVEQLNTKIEESKSDLEQIQGELKTLEKTNGIELLNIAKDKRQLNELFTLYVEYMRAAQAEVEDGNEEVEQEHLKKAKETWGQITQLIKDSYAEAEKGTSNAPVKERQSKVDNANEDKKNFLAIQDAKVAAQAWTQFATALGQVAMGWAQIKQLGKIWSDEDMSMGDKIVSTMTALSMIIPALVTSMTGLSAIKKAYVAILKTENLELTKEQINEYGAASAKIAKAMASIKATLATIKETIAEKGLIGAIKMAIAAIWTEIQALMAKIAAWAIANPELAIAIAIGTALAGVIGLVASSMNAEEKASERAAKALAKSKENLEETKNKYEELQNSINQYNSSVDALDKLKRGTEEWKQAVMELNEQVLTLMQLYPELSKYVTSSGGVLSIEQEGLDLMLKEQQQEVRDAQNSMIRNSNIKAVADYNKDIGNYTYTTDLANMSDSYGGISGMIGVLKADNNYGDQYKKEALVDQLNELAGFEHSMEYWTKYLETNSTELQNVVEATKNLETTLSVNNDILASNEIEDKITNNELTDENQKYYSTLDEESQQQLKDVTSIILSNNLDDYEYKTNVSEEDIQNLKGGGDFNKGKSDKEDAILVLKAQGLDPDDYDIKETGGANFKYRKKGESGEWEKENYQDNYDAVYNMLALQEKADEFDVDGLIEKFSQVEDKYGSTVNDIIQKYIANGGDLSSLTQKELDVISQTLEDEDFREEFKGIFGEDFDWEAMGVANGDLFINGLKHSVSDRVDISPEDIFGRVKEKAESFNQDAANLTQYDVGYLNANNVDSVEGYQELVNYSDDIVNAMPQLKDEMATFLDESKIGTQEWLDAVKEIQSEMGAIAEDEDGIFTKEEAKEAGLDTDTLDEAYARGDIDEDEYNSKFMGTLDAETEALGLNTEEVHKNADALSDLALESDEIADRLADDEKAALKVAKANARMNKGLEKLGSNFDDLADSINNGEDATGEYTSAINEMKEIMGDVLDIDPDMMSTDFIVENLDLIQKAAEGDTDAIQQLRVAASNDILMNVMGVSDFSSLDEDLQNEIAYVNQLAADNDFEIGASLDNTDFLNACTDIINQAGMTAEQATAYLASMGIDATVVEAPVTETATHTWARPVMEERDGYYIPTGQVETVTATDTVSGSGGFALEVSNATYTGKSGGTVSNKNKGGGKGKGGGGGGGAKADKKNYKDVKTNRYHDVEVALKDINNEMERLNKNRELLTGADLAASYQKELDLLNQEINALRQKQKLQKQEAKELRSKGHTVQKDGEVKQVKSLEEQGVTFDDKGNITNYNEAIVNKTNEINQMINDYNNLSADKQTDELKKQIEDAEFAYDQFMEDIERYETLTQDEMVETSKEIADALNKKIERKIEKFSMTIDLKIDTREAETRLEDFKSKMEKRDKTAAGRTQTAANKFMSYMDKDTGVQAEINRVNKIRKDIQKMQNGGHSKVYSEYDKESGKWINNTKAAEEDLKKYTEQMMSDMEDMEDLMDEINQGLLDTFDEIQESFDDQIAGYDAVSDHIAHNISLIEKLYGDDSSDKLGEWYDAQYENSLGKVDMLKKEADFWQEQMENAENDDAYKKAKENWMNSMNELNAAVEDTLDTVIAAYENSIDQIFDKLNKSLTNGLSLNYVGEEWELMNQNADRYLDTINSTYEVQKLQRKYQQSIDDTDSLSAQKKLNDLMQQEISYLEEKDKLTQYDIDRANLKYEIALKQIALEEAQQNKTTLRLKRDSQGNYSYQYAGDEEGVADKQQELADAQNQLYNLDKDAYRQNLDDMYNIYSEFQEKMMEVAKTYGRESEEYEKYKLLYEKQYGDMINGIVGENEYIKQNLMQSAYDALKEMYESDSESFANMTDLNMQSFEEMTYDIVNQQLPKIVNGNSVAIETIMAAMTGENGFENIMSKVWDNIAEAAKLYQDKVKAISDASGTDLNNLKVNTNEVLTTLKGWIEANDTIIANAEASRQAYEDIAKGVKAVADQFGKIKKRASKAAEESVNLQKKLNEAAWKNTAAQKTLNDLIAKLKEWNSIEPKVKTFTTITKNEGGGSSSGGGGATSSSSTSKTPVYYVVDAITKGEKFKKKMNSLADAQSYINSSDKQTMSQKYGGLIWKTFKTGGYTGTWTNGSDETNGRLAFLHQKELVLNEKDTSNLLDTIREMKQGNIFDNISNIMTAQIKEIQQESLYNQNKLTNQLSQIAQSLERLNNNIVEQQVSINAKFEDVRSSQSIIDAMEQLTNRASQMAFNVNRRK